MSTQDTLLVHAPIGRDPELIVSTLAAVDVKAVAVQNFADLRQAVQSGDAGGLLLTAEALSLEIVKELTEALAHQAHWSDLPVLILVPGGRESFVIRNIESHLSALPNLSLLERPIRRATLASVVRNALRSRARQYEVKRILEEKQQTALAMVESEKLAAVGRLASSIAHEINNPLEAVTNLLYLLRGETGLSKEGRGYVEDADRELTRVSQIASQTLRFHRQSTSASSVRPEALLNELLEIYKSRLAGADITISRKFEPDLRLTCYEGEIRQVLSNLVGNAFDVMRRGGHLQLRTRTATCWTSGQKGTLYTVADDGPGIPEGVLGRIFEAFYSTKGIHGTGLGLWISSRIIRKHGGRISVRSSTGLAHGTVFHVWLPAVLAETASERWDDEEFR